MKTNNNLLFLILIVAIIFTAASIIFFTYSIHEQKKANELRKENYDLKVQEINSKFDILDEKISRIEKSIEKISKKKTIRTYYSEDKNGNLGVVAIIDEVKECEKVVDSVFTSCIEPVTKTPKKQVSKKVSKKQVIKKEKKDNCCDSLLNKTKETNLILKRIELKMDSFKIKEPGAGNDSLEINLTKSNKDSSRVLFNKTLPVEIRKNLNPIKLNQNELNNFDLKNYGEFPVNSLHNFQEYLPNPYRKRKVNAFLWGAGLALVSGGLYAWSEGIGHPVFIEGEDNSDAEKKSDQIKYLRWASGTAAAGSAIQFGRAVRFHILEDKYIQQTKIGLTIDIK